MTKLLDEAIAKARKLPDLEQDLAAEVLLSVIGEDHPPYGLTPEQSREVERIQAGIRDGKTALASDNDVSALWKKCGL